MARQYLQQHVNAIRLAKLSTPHMARVVATVTRTDRSLCWSTYCRRFTTADWANDNTADSVLNNTDVASNSISSLSDDADCPTNDWQRD